MKDAIITCSDERFGDFLIEHWLASLEANVDLKNIDVIVLDYGLSKPQVERLKKALKGIIIFKGKRDGHVNVIRFRDIDTILSRKNYGQVLSVDGGDIIFQTDLSPLLRRDSGSFRAACERRYARFKRSYMSGFFPKEVSERIDAVLKGKREINAGVLLAPASKFRKLCQEVYALIDEKQKFGPDQHTVNYILHRDGFVELDEKYNFVVTVSKRRFIIKEGVFRFSNGEVIPIVHNAGHYRFFRPIERFGFGRDRNRLRWFFFSFVGFFVRLVDRLLG
ncbi:glycosyl transferase family 8 [Candidatus Woesearchaeota archaeon]|nr:glycosyl transferase family 8 [Candidatus Woesearchaeota archaeon]